MFSIFSFDFKVPSLHLDDDFKGTPMSALSVCVCGGGGGGGVDNGLQECLSVGFDMYCSGIAQALGSGCS